MSFFTGVFFVFAVLAAVGTDHGWLLFGLPVLLTIGGYTLVVKGVEELGNNHEL